MPERDEDPDRRLARREKPVSGPVEDFQPEDDGPDDGPQAADIARFGDVTIKCPECGTELFDDVALCWKCGRAVGSGAPDETKGPPLWAVITVIVIAAAFVIFLTRGLF
jgi:hypothetical protein